MEVHARGTEGSVFFYMNMFPNVLRYSQVDYNKLAELSGMSNPRSASNAWANIKKKIVAKGGITNGGGEDGTASPAKTPKTPKSGSRAKRGKKADDVGDDAEESPTKKAKPTPKGKNGKAVMSKPEVEEDEGDGEEGVDKQEEAADGE
jgi:hypothetical protein